MCNNYLYGWYSKGGEFMLEQMADAHIKLENVSYLYDNEISGGVQKINFEIRPGECVLLCGKSGCGKTTVTKLINGLIPNFVEGKKQGIVFLGGKNIEELAMYQISDIVASVFQNPKSQFFNIDPESEIVFTLENQGTSLEEVETRLKKTIVELELEPLLGKSMFAMSGGEKQRIAFACAYATNPEIIVLDEPTANLDMDATAQIAKIIGKLKACGKTILIAEHRLNWLKSLVDRIFLFENGKLIEEYEATSFYQKSDEWRRYRGLRQLENQSAFSAKSKHDGASHKLEFKNLYLAYERKCVASDLNFTLYSGEVTALTGRNGAGKTTLARCLCGLHKEATGDIFLDEGKLLAKQRRRISYLVMQDVNHQLFAESVEAECFLGSMASQADVNELLKEFDLYQFREKHPQTLSGGQKQRLAVVTALLSNKRVLIFDEPTSGLDYDNMLRVSKTLKALAEKDYFVLVITHDFELIESACDRCLRLENNQIYDL